MTPPTPLLLAGSAASPVIAVDPGKSGGLVWGDGSPASTHSAKMPATAHDLRDLVSEIVADLGTEPPVYMEKVGGFISGVRLPGSAMFNFGRNVGIIEGVIVTHELRLHMVTPVKWQSALSLGSKKGRSNSEWKNHLKAAAQNLFPTHKITLDTADAFLLYYAATRNLV